VIHSENHCCGYLCGHTQKKAWDIPHQFKRVQNFTNAKFILIPKQITMTMETFKIVRSDTDWTEIKQTDTSKLIMLNQRLNKFPSSQLWEDELHLFQTTNRKGFLEKKHQPMTPSHPPNAPECLHEV